MYARAAFDSSPVLRRVPSEQARLTVGAPGDAYEREADLLAGQVMRTPEGGHACACGGGCPRCRRPARLQASPLAVGGGGGLPVPPVVHDVVGSPGQPLPAEARAFMEPRFGRGFGDVRVHTGPRAAESARAVGARAYTVGRHVVFGAGQYAPGTTAGRHLLAHELAHTLQQQSGTVRLQRAIDITKEPTSHHATFGFRLRVSGLTVPCDKLLWEQWITGGITYRLADGKNRWASACAWVRGRRPDSDVWPPWCEDVTGDQPTGPRRISPAWPHAKCGGEPPNVLYDWDDAPGEFQNVGDKDLEAGKKIERIVFDIGINHKLWDRRYGKSPFFEKFFFLRGERSWGIDSTRIEL